MVGTYPDTGSRSAQLYERATRVLPGGASRSTILMKPYPIYVDAGEGAWLTDVDGHHYLDVINNFTSIVLGHAHPAIDEAVRAQLGRGTAFSLATEPEIELAELLVGRLDSADQVRFCNSGTEAVMGAIKAARAFTGRPAIVKIEGSYHGTYDHAEASLGSSPSDWGDPAAPNTVAYARGTPESLADEVAVIGFNDAAGAAAVIESLGPRCAGVLVDLMPSRVGMPPIDPDFLVAIRRACDEVGALLILDEVITFRLGPGGGQAIHRVEPDLTALAKIIGGGFPIGAVAGRAEVMSVFEAIGEDRAAVPSGGTYTANPITMTAGIACMQHLDDVAFGRLDEIGEAIRSGLRRTFDQAAVPWQVTGAGSLFRVHPHPRPIRNYRDARHSSDEAQTMSAMQHRLLEREVCMSPYGMGCVNLATSDIDIDHFLSAYADALASL